MPRLILMTKDDKVTMVRPCGGDAGELTTEKILEIFPPNTMLVLADKGGIDSLVQKESTDTYHLSKEEEASFRTALRMSVKVLHEPEESGGE